MYERTLRELWRGAGEAGGDSPAAARVASFDLPRGVGPRAPARVCRARRLPRTTACQRVPRAWKITRRAIYTAVSPPMSTEPAMEPRAANARPYN